MKTVLSWSSGKDGAWALQLLREQGVEVSLLLTTVNKVFGRVAMHGVRKEMLEAQAAAAGVPLMIVELPWPCENVLYEAIMKRVNAKLVADGFDTIAFGDLYLQDIRDYREKNLEGTGLTPLFPVWGIPTSKLAKDMMQAGLKSRITTVDPKQLDARFAGRVWDASLLSDLPAGVDPCGENGEFHSFAFDGPMFSKPIEHLLGEIVKRDGFVFADLLLKQEEVAVA
jgi:uncharacterized protein (TIGR00290 family)